ncbi:MAG: hypothetical protein ABSF67_04170 [Roseiarcus sp.]|jgi:hypothetical protein
MNRKLIGRSGAIALAMTLASGTAAQADDYNKVMVAGGTLLLAHLANVNADCTSRGAIDVRVLSGPSSGTIRIVQRADYSHFTGNFEQCNTRKISGESVYYTPQKGFTGSDSVQLDVFFPAGVERTAGFTITVK